MVCNARPHYGYCCHLTIVSGQAPPPQGPPPGANAQLWGWFKAVDTDNSGQLTVDELQRALINGDWSPFNIETVRTMVNMFDSGIVYRYLLRVFKHPLTLGIFLYFASRQHRHYQFPGIRWIMEVH